MLPSLTLNSVSPKWAFNLAILLPQPLKRLGSQASAHQAHPSWSFDMTGPWAVI